MSVVKADWVKHVIVNKEAIEFKFHPWEYWLLAPSVTT